MKAQIVKIISAGLIGGFIGNGVLGALFSLPLVRAIYMIRRFRAGFLSRSRRHETFRIRGVVLYLQDKHRLPG